MAREILQIEGLDELNRCLRELPLKLEKKVLRAAVKEAMTPVLHAVRSSAPVKSGLLVSTLRLVSRSSKRRGTVTAAVQTRDGNYKGEGFYAAFVEFGHHIGRRLKTAALRAFGDHRAEVPAHPFMRPALDENKDRVMSSLAGLIDAGLQKVAKEKA